MGYMTTVTILNDGFHGIEENPKKFVESIRDAMCGCHNGSSDRCGIYTYYVGNAGNNVQLAPSYHADESKLYLCGQNLMSDLSKTYGIELQRDVEFQLSRIRQARTILDYTEKELTRKLESINSK